MADVVCPNCAHRNPLGANFCSSCGTQLDGSDGDATTMSFVVENGNEEAADDHDVNVEIAANTAPETGLLIVKRGPNAGSRFMLDKQVTTAGRHPDSDIFLDDITVSRRHVEIAKSGSGYLVRDVGSLNGTYLNRERVEESPLMSGDELQIGKFRLVFLSGNRSEEGGGS